MIKEFISRGEIYEIEINEPSHLVHMRPAGQSLGTINLNEREDDFPKDGYYHICHLALDACKGRGLGQACLEFHKENYSAPLTAAQPGSGSLPDGSHLIGDGIPFIARMRAKRIVAPVERCRDEEVALLHQAPECDESMMA
jgi:hypothetical protein